MQTDDMVDGNARFVLNPHATGFRTAPRATREVIEFHRRLPGYRPTPCWPLPSVAAELGLKQTWLKDESSRLGLPAFKILGASWATYATLASRVGVGINHWRDFHDLQALLQPVRPLTLVTATDGNHGRAVARVARWLGFDARVFVPAGTAPARIAAIESEGARVAVVDGSYDDAVAAAAADGAEPGRMIISDTSWEGYTEIPSRVIDGYATLFAEAQTEIRLAGEASPDLVVVQTGVGALAAAAVRACKGAGSRSAVMNVEPLDADCVLRSFVAGKPVKVPGPHRSMMAGLNCGTPSLVAWPELAGGIDCFAAIPDAFAEGAMRRLAATGIVSGETGASGLGGLTALLTDPAAGVACAALGLGPDSSVLVISTEGATDPENYERIVGRTPEMVPRLAHPMAHG